MLLSAVEQSPSGTEHAQSGPTGQRAERMKYEEVESLRKKFAGIKVDRKEREEAEAVKVAAQLKK